MARTSWDGLYLERDTVGRRSNVITETLSDVESAPVFVTKIGLVPVYAAGGSVRFWSKTPPPS